MRLNAEPRVSRIFKSSFFKQGGGDIMCNVQFGAGKCGGLDLRVPCSVLYCIVLYLSLNYLCIAQ